MIWRALFPRGRIQGLDPRGVVLRACSREHDAQKAERAMSTHRRWVLHAEKGHAQTPDTAAGRRRLQRCSTESFDTLHCSAEGNFGTPPELVISSDHTESVHSLGPDAVANAATTTCSRPCWTGSTAGGPARRPEAGGGRCLAAQREAQRPVHQRGCAVREGVRSPCLPALRACGLWPALATRHAQHVQASA
jgi:hypothetical protein